MFKNLVQGLQDPSPECRGFFLKSDLGLTALTLFAGVLLTPIVAYLDFVNLGLSGVFFQSFALELAFILVSLPLAVSLNRNASLLRYEQWVAAWALGLSLAFSVISFLQPSRLAQNLTINLIFLIACHVLIANRLVYRLVPALVLSLGGLIIPIFFHTDYAVRDQVFVILAILVLNGIGLVIASRNNSLKTEGFEIFKREREAREQFETSAGIDYLTGIFNRRHFTENFDLELSRFKRYNTTFSFAFIAIDRFKAISEMHGIVAGEEALKVFSTIIKEGKRKTDIFGRLGEEEFGLIMMETSGEDTLKTVQRYLGMVSEQNLPSANSSFKISFSAGITEIKKFDRNADDLIRRADKALFTARELGGNCCILN